MSEAAQADSFLLRVVQDAGDYDLSFPARALRRPGRDEVEIQLRAWSLSVGDLSKLRESDGKEMELVHGCAGRIVDVGDGDNSFAIGDEVIALVSTRPGVFVIASNRCVTAKPPGVSVEDAALLPLAFLNDGLAQGVLSARVFTDGSATGVLDISQSQPTRRIVLSLQTNADESGNISGRPLTFRSDGTYLIAGGLGGLGLTVAEWMVAHGARYLVLVGRRQASPAVEEILARLRAAGAQVRIAQADISQPADVGRVMREIKASMPRLRGIIHSASVLDDGILINQTAERFKTVWEPKVSGVWNLHEQTPEEELDFFIMFSSAASVLGSPGQSNYVTANSFLDGLAHYRRAKGLPGLSINWGPWSEVGGAAVIGSEERLAARGAESIRPSQGVEALGQVLASDATQIAVMPFDLRQWSKFYPKAAESSSLLIGLLGEQNEFVSHAQTNTMYRKLLAAKPEQRERLLQTHLQQQIAEVLGFAPEQIGIHVSLGDLGFDSLVAVDVKGRLEASLELTLSPTLIWNYPTVAELARFLLEQMELPVKAGETSGSEPDKQTAADLDQLSQDELAALLEREIAHAAERNPS
jgi:NADPH:quinone reductase-like Zn-dependent oxidoreductase/acyl carrier protein